MSLCHDRPSTNVSRLSITVVPGLLPAMAPGLLLRLAQSCRAAARTRRLSSCRSDPSVSGRRGYDLWLRHVDGGPLPPVEPTRPGYALDGICGEPGRDLTAGAVSGIANAVVGLAGPPVLMYLLLAGAEARTVRAALLAFFALSYGETLGSHAVTIGIPAPTWVAAGILIPRRPRRPADRRSPRRQSLRDTGDRPPGGGGSLYPRRRGRCLCPLISEGDVDAMPERSTAVTAEIVGPCPNARPP
jgi:hypothetical protein